MSPKGRDFPGISRLPTARLAPAGTRQLPSAVWGHSAATSTARQRPPLFWGSSSAVFNPRLNLPTPLAQTHLLGCQSGAKRFKLQNHSAHLQQQPREKVVLSCSSSPCFPLSLPKSLSLLTSGSPQVFPALYHGRITQSLWLTLAIPSWQRSGGDTPSHQTTLWDLLPRDSLLPGQQAAR